jgi:hypothetical protein
MSKIKKFNVGTVLRRKSNSLIGVCVLSDKVTYILYENGTHEYYKDDFDIEILGVAEDEKIRNFYRSILTMQVIDDLFDKGFFNSVFKYGEYGEINVSFENKKIKDIIIL